MERKNVLLIGGTGAMGMYLVPFLLEKGYKVYVTSRSARRSDNENLIYLQGNGHDVTWLNELKAEIAFSSVVDFMLYSYDEFKKNVKDLLLLGDQYIFSSSYRVYGNATETITEESPRKLDLLAEQPELESDTYGITKARQEDLLLNSNKGNFVIVRPGMTFSKNRFQFGAMDNFDIFRSVRGGKSMLPDSMIDRESTLTYGKDVALMIAAMVDNPKTYRQVYNVVTNESHSWREIADIYHDVFGLELVVISDKLYTQVTNQWRTMIDRRFDRIFDNQKLLKDTGLSNRDFYSLRDALTEAWADSDHDRFRNGRTNWPIQAMMDHYTNSSLDMTGVSSQSQKAYYDELNTLKMKGSATMKASDFSKHSNFWNVRELPWNDYIELVRTGSHTLYAPRRGENRWMSYNLHQKLEVGTTYKVTMDLMSDASTVLNLFFSGSGTIQKLPLINLSEGQWQHVEFEITAEEANSHLTVTATDIPVAGKRLCIKEITVTKQ